MKRKRSPEGKTQTEQVLDLVDAGVADPRVYRTMFPVLYFRNWNQIQRLIAEHRGRDRLNHLLPWKSPKRGSETPPCWQPVINWCNWIHDTAAVCKRMHLWLYGPPNTRKTTLVNNLTSMLPTYIIQKDPTFNAGWDAAVRYSLAVCDEFGGEKSLQWINEFCGGGTMLLRMVGGGYATKEYTVPLLITSNQSIAECYSDFADEGHREVLNAFRSRFYEIRVDTPWDPFDTPVDTRVQEALNELMSQ